MFSMNMTKGRDSRSGHDLLLPFMRPTSKLHKSVMCRCYATRVGSFELGMTHGSNPCEAKTPHRNEARADELHRGRQAATPTEVASGFKYSGAGSVAHGAWCRSGGADGVGRQSPRPRDPAHIDQWQGIEGGGPDERTAAIFRAALFEMQKNRSTDRLIEVVVTADASSEGAWRDAVEA
jgi:hypothetical protein